jgi:hypothetical protein
LIAARPCRGFSFPGSASGKALHSLRVEHGGNVLKVEGVIIAVISHVEHSSVHFGRTNYHLQIPTELKRVAIRIGLQQDSLDSNQLKAFTRAVSCNIFAERFYPPSEDLETAAQSRKALYSIFASDTSNEHYFSQHITGDVVWVIKRARQLCEGRCFYLTRDGMPGLAPLATIEGDIVTVLMGCEYPIILWLTKEGNYKVVGQA